MNVDNSVSTPLEMTARIADALSASTSQSLPEYTAPTRLSAITLIDKSVLAVDQGLIKSLLQTMLSIYSAHYLQAINIAMNVGDVKVMRLLNQFSTDRDLLRSVGNSRWLGNESFNTDSTTLPKYGLEANDDIKRSGDRANLDKSIAVLNEDSNLAVGKVLEVKINNGDYHTTIPVTVNLQPMQVAADDIVGIITDSNIDTSMSGRYHQWRSGKIHGIRDYLFNLDLLAADRRTLMRDSTSSLLMARTKRTKGILSTLLSGYASPNAVSTMAVISKATAGRVELALGGKLRSTRVRTKFWSNTSTMMLVVVDTVMERFTLYQRGINSVGTYTLDDIKNNGTKPGGADIDAILAAYKLGDSPTL